MNLKYLVPDLSIASAVSFTIIVAFPSLSFGQEKAQTNTVRDQNYQLERHENGFVRLDRSSGKTSFCRPVGEDIVCKLAVEERDALHLEISELQNKIAAMQGKLDQISSDSSQLRRPPKEVPDPYVGEKSGAGRDEIEKEVDRAIDLTKNTMRKLFKAVKELQKDMGKE
jgi:hypothetical protein